MSDIYPPGTRSHFFPQRCGFLLIDFFFSPSRRFTQLITSLRAWGRRLASSAAFRVRRDPAWAVACQRLGRAGRGLRTAPPPAARLWVPPAGRVATRPGAGGRAPGLPATRTPPRGCATSGHVSAGRMTGGSTATAACPPPGARPAAPRPALLLLLSRGQGPRGPLCNPGVSEQHSGSRSGGCGIVAGPGTAQTPSWGPRAPRRRLAEPPGGRVGAGKVGRGSRRV